MISEENEEAFDILMQKYKILIAKKVKEFNFKVDLDDYFQEGYIILYKSILSYDDSVGTFYYFFLRNLTNKFLTLAKRNMKSNVVVDSNDFFRESREDDDFTKSNILKGLNEEERTIIYLKFEKNWAAKKIANKLGIEENKIYYKIKLILEKIKRNIE